MQDAPFHGPPVMLVLMPVIGQKLVLPPFIAVYLAR